MDPTIDDQVLLLGALVLMALLVAVGVALYRQLRRLARELAERADDLRRAIGPALPPVAPLALALRGPRPVPRARYMYMRPGGVPAGPVDLTQLRAMLLDGRLNEQALVAGVGTDVWQALAELLTDETAEG